MISRADVVFVSGCRRFRSKALQVNLALSIVVCVTNYCLGNSLLQTPTPPPPLQLQSLLTRSLFWTRLDMSPIAQAGGQRKNKKQKSPRNNEGSILTRYKASSRSSHFFFNPITVILSFFIVANKVISTVKNACDDANAQLFVRITAKTRNSVMLNGNHLLKPAVKKKQKEIQETNPRNPPPPNRYFHSTQNFRLSKYTRNERNGITIIF